jgi:hypothetical protein
MPYNLQVYILSMYSYVFKICKKKKVPSDGSDELKHVADCCVALQCYVWR